MRLSAGVRRGERVRERGENTQPVAPRASRIGSRVGVFGASWGSLGALLALSWPSWAVILAHLWLSCSILGNLGRHCCSSCGYLGLVGLSSAILDHFGGILDHVGAILASTWTSKTSKKLQEHMVFEGFCKFQLSYIFL